MTFNLIIIKKPSYLGRQNAEILEAIMSLGLFDIEHKIVFFEQAISWLLTHQNPEHEKSVEKQINALPMYGCEAIHYIDTHANELYPNQSFNDQASKISEQQLADWLREAKHVEVFG